MSLSTHSGSSTRILELLVFCKDVTKACNTVRTVEMNKQAVTRCYKRTRLHHFMQSGVLSTTCGRRCRQMLFKIHPLQLLRDMLHLAYTVGDQDDTKIRCSELPTGQTSSSDQPKLFERSVNSRLSSEEHPKEFAQLALQDNSL